MVSVPQSVSIIKKDDLLFHLVLVEVVHVMWSL